MRFSIVKEVFKKEILELIRDKKNLFMMFILPILMYPLITIGASQIIMSSMNDINRKEVRLLVDDNIDAELYNYLKNSDEIRGDKDQGKITIEKKNTDEKEVKKGIKDETYDLALVRGDRNSYKIYVDTRLDKAELVVNRLSDILKKYKDKIIDDNLKAAGINPKDVLNPISYTKVSVAESQEEASGLIGRIIPFMLIMGILSGAVYPAADMIAGEKERGTLETLLTVPIKNIELIAGKYMSVAFTAIVSAIINLVSMGLTTYYFYLTASSLMGGMDIRLDISKIILPVILTIVSLLLFTLVIAALSLCVCSFARTYKQAQGYLTPLMLVTMIPAYASMIPMLKLNPANSVIPVVNVVLLIKSVFFMDVSMKLASIVLLSNLAFICIALAILSKVFRSEEVLFGSGEGISLLKLRRNIKEKSIPSVSDGILIFAVEFVCLLTLGGYLQVKYKTLGILASQLILLAIVFAYSWYIKVDFKKVFCLNKLDIRKILYGVLMWIGALVAVIGLSAIIVTIFPSAKETSKQLSNFMMGKNMILNVVAVALAPAVCEELLFRGFILSAFSNNKSIYKKYSDDPSLRTGKTSIIDRGSSMELFKLLEGDKAAVIFSGILFGIMHVYWFKIPTTAILGIVFAVAVKRSNSIGTSMVGHFLNNLLALLVTSIAMGII